MSDQQSRTTSTARHRRDDWVEPAPESTTRRERVTQPAPPAPDTEDLATRFGTWLREQGTGGTFAGVVILVVAITLLVLLIAFAGMILLGGIVVFGFLFAVLWFVAYA